tara:strand:- start:174 stop:323 length:150 start_codon:yes stop_codon:yes gene_type:complete
MLKFLLFLQEKKSCIHPHLLLQLVIHLLHHHLLLLNNQLPQFVLAILHI